MFDCVCYQMCPLGWILNYLNTIIITAFMGGYELIRPESG